MEYRRKFREQPGELTPRNLDHSVSGGFGRLRGQKGLDLWELLRGFSSPPVTVLHPTGGKGDGQ